MSCQIPTPEEIDRLQHALDLADALARTLDQIEVPSEADICTIEEAAKAAGSLFATLKAAEECEVG